MYVLCIKKWKVAFAVLLNINIIHIVLKKIGKYGSFQK